jgi:hypothetical protein
MKLAVVGTPPAGAPSITYHAHPSTQRQMRKINVLGGGAMVAAQVASIARSRPRRYEPNYEAKSPECFFLWS